MFSRDAFDCYLQKENESRKDFRANKTIEFESERGEKEYDQAICITKF